MLTMLAFVACESDDIRPNQTPAKGDNEQYSDTTGEQNTNTAEDDAASGNTDNNVSDDDFGCGTAPFEPDYHFIVTGTVTNRNGEPFENIFIENDLTSKIVQTDEKGRYSLLVGVEKDRYPWQEGETPNITLRYGTYGSQFKSVTYEFTEKHLVDNPDSEVSEYIISDADVVYEPTAE